MTKYSEIICKLPELSAVGVFDIKSIKGGIMSKCTYCGCEIKQTGKPGRPFARACGRLACQTKRHAQNIRACLERRLAYNRQDHALKI